MTVSAGVTDPSNAEIESPRTQTNIKTDAIIDNARIYFDELFLAQNVIGI